jgi:hypothetical protein
MRMAFHHEAADLHRTLAEGDRVLVLGSGEDALAAASTGGSRPSGCAGAPASTR